MNFGLQQKSGREKHHFIRQLYYLSHKMTAELFDLTLQRALTYRIKDFNIIERIAVLLMNEVHFEMPRVSINEEFMTRTSFIEGRFTD